MAMRNQELWIAVFLLAAAGAACNRDKRAEQLAALDRGYEAGLLTKAEYDAKKAVILGSGAPLPQVQNAAPAQPEPSVAAAPPPAPPPTAAGPPTPSNPPAATAPQTRAAAPASREPAAQSPPVSAAPSAAPPPPEPAPSTPPPAEATPAPEGVPRRSAAAGEPEEEPAPLAGCREIGVKPGKEKGRQERFFPMPLPRVKQAAIGALEALEFKINKDSGREIEATKKRHIGILVGSGGEKMVLQFQSASEGRQSGTLVIGETKKGFIMRAGQKSWTNAVLMQTGCMLRNGR